MKSTLKLALTLTLALLAFTGFSQQKVGYISYEMLMSVMPERDSAAKKLEAFQKESTETFNAMQTEFNAKVKAFDEKKDSYTEGIRAQKQKELSDFYQRLQEYSQAVLNDGEELQQKLTAPINDKIMKTISKVAKANGFAYIVSSASLLFVDDAQITDILPLVKKEMGINK